MQNATEQRKKLLLRAVVQEYVRTAEPVGSETIVSHYDLGVSPATVRNDMAELEEQGLLEQPHTSSGRIPTAQGYRFYVHEFVRPPFAEASGDRRDEPPADARQTLDESLSRVERDADRAFKDFARTMAALTAETIVIRLGRSNGYLTGVSNLMRKPEFRKRDLLIRVTEAMDDLDRVLTDIERRLSRAEPGGGSGEIEVFIGEENPFGSHLSSVLTKYELPGFGEGIIGIVGPTRMDYDANVAIMKYIRKIFHDVF